MLSSCALRIPDIPAARSKCRISLISGHRPDVMTATADKPTMDQRILEPADRLFYLRGIRAVGVDTIAAEIGISKRTLYNHFPSKDELISAYLARRFSQVPASDKPPSEQILGTFDALERRFASKSFRGCPYVNAVVELGAADQSVRKIAIAFKENL